ncbi:MAG: cupin domain-containing protein [Solirubrobacterales bacterium]
MSGTAVPRLVDGAEAEGYSIGAEGQGGFVRRLISRDQSSRVLLGLYRLDPGQRTTFELPLENGIEEETYYLLGGRLAVRWRGGELVVERGQAIFFPVGGSYAIETVGSTPVELIWTGFPAPLPLSGAGDSSP